MSKPIISVRGISKQYRLGMAKSQDTLRDQLSHWAKGLGHPKPESSTDSFWALRDVSFDVQPGEVIGIIGRNGAGKSTLLKVLSQITEPTEGEIYLRGRLASLLEVGTGFHQELTGRENIFLNGVILGMTKAEVRAKFDEIVEFAEVGKFLDTPVKRYSSGMYVRLAFAVAAHLEPEILVVDEVLAVGDAAFQNKCLGKMQDVAKNCGRTVLFVSHNMAAVQALCGRIIHMAGGKLIGDGRPDTQINAYLGEIKKPRTDTAMPLGKIIECRQMEFNPNPIVSGQPMEFTLELGTRQRTQLIAVAILIYSAFGQRVAILDLRTTAGQFPIEPGRPFRCTGRIKNFPLVEGDYRVGLYMQCSEYDGDYHDLASLTVSAATKEGELAPYAAHFRGLVELDCEMKT
ncbi:MAG: ABC transporter ATP-binding protein [Limisphaerales bacterium]